MNRVASFALAVVMIGGLCLVCRTAPAAVAVGDQPNLAFKATDGSPVSLDKLKGKIVVVDFWATWCGPCMAEAGHMVAINQKYQKDGFQFIGISLDQPQDAAKMATVVKEKGFAWPQFIDGTGGTTFANAWGVNSIPRTFIIGPDGKVLWTGHPARIDAEFVAAFRDHPPFLVDPKLLSEAKATLEKATAAIKDGNTKAAFAAMAKVPAAAKADKDFAAAADAVRKDLESAAEKMLADVEPTIEAKDYLPAVTKLRELSLALEGSAAGTKAKKRLAELEAKPEVKSAITKASRNEKAQALLEAAQQLKDAKKDEQAYPKFKSLATEYPDTDSGIKAANTVKEYEKDTAFVKRVNESAASTKATSTLKLAQSYVTAGRPELARKKYQEVIDLYPNTSYADQAKAALASLGK